MFGCLKELNIVTMMTRGGHIYTCCIDTRDRDQNLIGAIFGPWSLDRTVKRALTLDCHANAQDCWRPIPTYCARLCTWAESTWRVILIGVVNKMKYLWRSQTLPNDSKHNEASFSTISTDMLYLRVAQTPRSPDLAIFVLTTDKTDYFTPCACAQGNYTISS